MPNGIGEDEFIQFGEFTILLISGLHPENFSSIFIYSMDATKNLSPSEMRKY